MRRIYRDSLLVILLTAIMVLFFVLHGTRMATAQDTSAGQSKLETLPPPEMEDVFEKHLDRSINEFRRLTSPLSSCRDMITYEGYDPTKKENPVWNRLVLDNCTNQYIAQRSAVTNVFEPEGAMLGIDESFCQQIRIPHDDLISTKIIVEYNPSEYLKNAWVKTLIGAKRSKKNANDPDEPYVIEMGNDTFIQVKRPICLPGAKLGRKDENSPLRCVDSEGKEGGSGLGTSGSSGGGGGGTPWCPDWSLIDSREEDIMTAAAATGVPYQLIKAVMALESCGENLAPNKDDATGPMQVVYHLWGHLVTGTSDPNINLAAMMIPSQNIMAGAGVLKDGAINCGNKRPDISPWEAAVRCYYGGEGALFNDAAADSPENGGSGIAVTQYWKWVEEDWMEQGGEGMDSVPGSGAGGTSSRMAGSFPPVKMTDYIKYNDPSDPTYNNFATITSSDAETRRLPPTTANPERILDASHPFSPRHDVTGTDQRMGATCDPTGTPVDILRFRGKAFSACVSARKNFNNAEQMRWANCLESRNTAIANGDAIIPYCAPLVQCALDVRHGDPDICKTMFGPFGGANIQQEGECCYNITKPVAPLNILKIRHAVDTWPCPSDANAGDCKTADSPSRKNGETEYKAPEGYSFAEYFKYGSENRARRPFMRWWDTLAENSQPKKHKLTMSIDDGADDVLVGVGREKESCGYGGGNGKDVVAGGDVVIDVPMPGQFKVSRTGNVPTSSGQKTDDKVYYGSSWMELKLYQVRGRRDFHLNCLTKYEKLMKYGSAENFVLSRAGGEWSLQRVYDDDTKRTISDVFALRHRGYVAEPNRTYRFPWLDSNRSNAAILQGLDNARPGDILIWEKETLKAGNAKRLPMVAYVRETAGDPKNPDKAKFIKVRDFNNGKYPDACGGTDMWGLSPTRTLYRSTSAMPRDMQAAFKAHPDATPSCDNPTLSVCVEPLWDNVLIYRPTKDVRTGGAAASGGGGGGANRR